MNCKSTYGLPSLCVALLFFSTSPAAAQIALGTAQSFGVLAGTTVTNTGGTVVSGSVGVSPGGSVTGFPPGGISGGSIHSNDGAAMQAQSDLSSAYNTILATPCTVNLPGPNLGGLTLTPGVYCLSGSASLSGTLTLDATNDPNALFLFKVGASLTASAGSSVVFINTAGGGCNQAYWQVSTSATLGPGSSFGGDILAANGITLNTGANTSGRALTRNGSVTLDTNNVNTCGTSVCPTISVNPATLPNGTAGAPYNQTVSALGGAPPYSFAIVSGALPAGLNLNGFTGAINGTPAAAGTSTFSIEATDSNGCSGSRSYTLTTGGVGVTLTPSSQSIAQNGLLTLQLSAPPASSIDVTVSSSSPEIVRVPDVVTIPAGQTSALIPLTGLGRGTSTISVQLPAANGGGSASADVTVTSGLTIQLTPASRTAPIGSVTYTVTINAVQSSSTVLSLSSSDPSIATVPATATLPAEAPSTTFVATASKAGTTQVYVSLPPSLGGSVASASLTIVVQQQPANVFASLPAPLLETADNNSTASSTYALTNIGGTATTISLGKGGDQNGNFFIQTPSQPFPLAPGATQIVTITSAAQPLPVLLTGVSIPTGAGVTPGLQLPVQLFAHAAMGVGVPNVVAVSSRVDVASPIGGEPGGEISFRNDGNATAFGVLSADKVWIVPPRGIIQIEPGMTTQPIPFRIDRALQPDVNDPAGSITGKINFVYPLGSPGGSAKTILDTPPGAFSLAGLVINDTRQKDVSANAVPLLASGEIALFIPGIGHVVGSGGKEFISDVSIASTDSVVGVPDLKLFFSSSAPTVRLEQALSPSRGLLLADAVTQSFKLSPPAQGTLHVRAKDTSRLAVSANVFNKSDPKGTFGTAIPVFRSNRVISSGQKLYLTGLRNDALAHTNLYFQETSGAAAMAHVEFFDESGASKGTLDTSVDPFSYKAAGAVIPRNAVMAAITNTSGGSLQAYATPVDDAGGDTWAIADWNSQYGLTGSEPMLIPVAGFVSANGANFRTDVAVSNIGSATGNVTLTYYPRGGSEVVKTISLGPNQTRTVSDVTESLFELAGTSLGAITALPNAGSRFAITSRTYTASAADPATYGTGVPTLALNSALRAGQAQIFGGIQDVTLKTQLARAGGTFRTNLALFETTGQPASVKVAVYFSDGRSLVAGGANGTQTYALAPHGFLQLNGLVREILGAAIRDSAYGDLNNVQVRVEVLNGSAGAVVPFITATDNGTSDTVLRTE